jgi:hypothetical protein
MLQDVPSIVKNYIQDKGEESLLSHAEFLKGNNYKCESQVKRKNKLRQNKRHRT